MLVNFHQNILTFLSVYLSTKFFLDKSETTVRVYWNSGKFSKYKVQVLVGAILSFLFKIVV